MHNSFDVIIVGAGLSGIGAACHLQKHCPDQNYAILEGRAATGGTWDLFRYPGIRSDSDMHTLGYNFKPWVDEKAIAEGPAILHYIRETAQENGIAPNIRCRHRVLAANWNSDIARWQLRVDTPAGEQQFSCRHLLMCVGYYSYSEPYDAQLPGLENYRGRQVHPQFWPQDLDYTGKKVVVIGSGATAMTLVPAMAERAAHITMLQRSPTYLISRPWRDRIANFLRAVLPVRWAYAITRRKNILLQQMFYRRTRTNPERIRKLLLDQLRKKLNPDIDIDKHFSPGYNPWDQRLCLIPDDDLHIALNAGKASVVTDQIETFTGNGVRLQSGTVLEADIVIPATGLQLVLLGEIELSVDGKAVVFSDTRTYRGLMLSGVPNLVNTFGYINASWTLGADLTAEYFCQLVRHMEAIGADQVVPCLRPREETMPRRHYIEGFSSGYMQRVMHLFPRQGDREPWLNTQDYIRDKKLLHKARFDDGALRFSAVPKAAAENEANHYPLQSV